MLDKKAISRLTTCMCSSAVRYFIHNFPICLKECQPHVKPYAGFTENPAAAASGVTSSR